MRGLSAPILRGVLVAVVVLIGVVVFVRIDFKGQAQPAPAPAPMPAEAQRVKAAEPDKFVPPQVSVTPSGTKDARVLAKKTVKPTAAPAATQQAPVASGYREPRIIQAPQVASTQDSTTKASDSAAPSENAPEIDMDAPPPPPGASASGRKAEESKPIHKRVFQAFGKIFKGGKKTVEEPRSSPLRTARTERISLRIFRSRRSDTQRKRRCGNCCLRSFFERGVGGGSLHISSRVRRGSASNYGRFWKS